MKEADVCRPWKKALLHFHRGNFRQPKGGETDETGFVHIASDSVLCHAAHSAVVWIGVHSRLECALWNNSCPRNERKCQPRQLRLHPLLDFAGFEDLRVVQLEQWN